MATSRKRKLPAPPKPPVAADVRVEFETFRRPAPYTIHDLKDDAPSFSGLGADVSVRKYRVTIDLVEEPVEVIHARLIELWETCDNHHHWRSLKHEAARYGLVLSMDRCGIRATRKGS